MSKTLKLNYLLCAIILLLIVSSISHTLWINLDITLFGDVAKYLNPERITKRLASDHYPIQNFIIISNTIIIEKIDLFGLIFIVFLSKALIFYFCLRNIKSNKIIIFGFLFLIASPHNLVFEFIITKEYLSSVILLIIVFLSFEQHKKINLKKKNLLAIKFVEYFLMFVLIQIKYLYIILFFFKLLYDFYLLLEAKTKLSTNYIFLLVTICLFLISFCGLFFLPEVYFNEELLLNIFKGLDPVLLSAKEPSRLVIETSCLFCGKTFINILNFLIFSVVDIQHLNYPLIWIFIIENTIIKIIIMYLLFIYFKQNEFNMLLILFFGLFGSILPYCLLNSGAAIRYWGALNDPLILIICYLFYFRSKIL